MLLHNAAAVYQLLSIDCQPPELRFVVAKDTRPGLAVLGGSIVALSAAIAPNRAGQEVEANSRSLLRRHHSGLEMQWGLIATRLRLPSSSRVLDFRTNRASSLLLHPMLEKCTAVEAPFPRKVGGVKGFGVCPSGAENEHG